MPVSIGSLDGVKKLMGRRAHILIGFSAQSEKQAVGNGQFAVGQGVVASAACSLDRDRFFLKMNDVGRVRIERRASLHVRGAKPHIFQFLAHVLQLLEDNCDAMISKITACPIIRDASRVPVGYLPDLCLYRRRQNNCGQRGQTGDVFPRCGKLREASFEPWPHSFSRTASKVRSMLSVSSGSGFF